MDDISSLILGNEPKYSVDDVKKMVYGQESSFGKADTSKPNYAGAYGTMQITKGTFQGLKKKGLIPANYDINNSEHSKKAGEILVEDLYGKHGGDVDKVLAEYYSGSKAVEGDKIHTEFKDLKNPKAPTVGEYIEQAKSKFEPNDEISGLILGLPNKKETKKPTGFFEEVKKPLSEMSIEEFKQQSLLPKIATGMAGSREQKLKMVKELYPTAQKFVGGIQEFAKHPLESTKAIAKEVIEHPGKVIGETIKGAIYDPELALLPGMTAEKTISKGAKQLGEQFAKKESTMAGVGAAEVGAQNKRIARAKELPIPIELSKDQATRNPADVRFARETAKDPILGQALQEKYATDNAKIQQNLDKFIEDTGAEYSSAGTPTLGKMLLDTVEPYKNARKAEIEPAYTRAREAGHMSEPIEINPLQQFVEKNISAAKNAPVLGALENELKRLSKEGKMSINDLEEVRKMANVLAQDSGPNSYYGTKAIKLIDKITENKGGELYKEARKLNTEYMREFENTPVIKNIFAMKRGTTQRATAIEDLVDKSLLKGPKEDVVQLFNTLQKSGPEGQAMINEMRGYVAQKIKDEATKGVSLDINGKPYVSTKNLDTIVKNLDKSGKLDFIFGKKGAEHYRTLNEVTKDLQTVPQGVTNPSGTAATLLGALTEMGIQGATTGVPVPIAMIGKELYKKRQTKQKLNKISEFINYSKEK